MELSHVTFLIFTVFSSLRTVSYIPHVKVASDTNGATAISYATWSLWTGANVATALYAAVNLSDLYLAAVSGIYAACCVIVIIVTMVKRRSRLRSSDNIALSPRKRSGDDIPQCY
jgi:hypothetical protein